MFNRFLFIALLSGLLISCKEKEQPEDLAAWKIKGDSLVNRTFDTLRNTLQRAVAEKGFAGAVDFCKTEALALTNTYSKEGISVKRSSDKLRNPSNAPDSMELRILATYRQWKTEKKELKGVLEKDGSGNYHYFKPILLQTLCLNCHGNPVSAIKPDTWKMIQQKYPADAAFDYQEGDLRGIWHIRFSQKNNLP